MKNVQVHKFICAGTLEERIDEMIEKKKEISEGVVGAGEAWLTELSTSDSNSSSPLARMPPRNKFWRFGWKAPRKAHRKGYLRMSWRYHEYFQPSRPKAVKGGIKAQSKRGGFGESWWAKRWIAVLESFNIGARLGRGRSYARNGQVLSINIEKGVVKAKVQGSRTKPYEITINV